MRIAIVGVGYVGLVTGVCFAEMGNTVTCIDVDKKKIQNLNKGINIIYEPSLDSMIEKNLKKNSLFFTAKQEPPYPTPG
jgi:UDPglucose 6-dehydrogenase